MSELIEDCLRARGVRFFHGHHEREYFFLLDYLDRTASQPRSGKLHVHLDRGGAAGDEITVTVTPDRFYPAADRERLSELAQQWGAGGGAAVATLHPSSDPGLVGVAASDSDRPVDVAALSALVDRTVGAALDLFGRMHLVVASTARQTGLRDAG